jgi:hypothetical protein
MILFLADGRLGNQLFQYAFLKTIQTNNEKILVSGFEELIEVFEIKGIININKKNRLLKFLLYTLIKPILNFLSDINIFSSAAVQYEEVMGEYRRESIEVNRNQGYLRSLTFVKLGFFQSEAFFDKEVVSPIKIKNNYIDAANKFLGDIPKNSHKVFIHIRRGDYKNYKVYGKSTLLPMSYFKQQIEWFKKNKENSFFVFLSDDCDFIEKEFADLDNKIISTNNDMGTDFAIMTCCNSAILSPSSFGWWGSYMMEQRDFVFAPMYWLGFNSKCEYHSGATPTFSRTVKI